MKISRKMDVKGEFVIRLISLDSRSLFGSIFASSKSSDESLFVGTLALEMTLLYQISALRLSFAINSSESLRKCVFLLHQPQHFRELEPLLFLHLASPRAMLLRLKSKLSDIVAGSWLISATCTPDSFGFHHECFSEDSLTCVQFVSHFFLHQDFC